LAPLIVPEIIVIRRFCEMLTSASSFDKDFLVPNNKYKRRPV
jgi:hypothetical protein